MVAGNPGPDMSTRGYSDETNQKIRIDCGRSSRAVPSCSTSAYPLHSVRFKGNKLSAPIKATRACNESSRSLTVPGEGLCRVMWFLINADVIER